MDHKDIQKAVILAHSIKGVAGNIGAYDMQAAAAGLEDVLNSGDQKSIEKNLHTFLFALESLKQALVGFPPEDHQTDVQSGKKPASNPAALIKALHRLEDSIELRMPINCTEAMKEIMNLSWSKFYEKDVANIKSFLNQYKFEEAESLLKFLISQMEKGGNNNG